MTSVILMSIKRYFAWKSTSCSKPSKNSSQDREQRYVLVISWSGVLACDFFACYHVTDLSSPTSLGLYWASTGEPCSGMMMTLLEAALLVVIGTDPRCAHAQTR